ncbi:MAG: hypothetical protein IJ519_03925, partial [Clostridia bacterium]|nr:hypothetical protein [Clostridia bacterium]
IGRAAKAAEYITADRKDYTATLKLGLTYDTEDVTGTLLTEHEGALPSPDKVKEICESFIGEGEQIPPMYSAIKIGGRKLVDMARKNIEIERPSRPITVYRLDCEELDEDEYLLHASVSAGTYIRTLCADIGKALGCGGAMKTLKRTAAGMFTLDGAYTLSQIEEMTEEERYALLKPTEELFFDLDKVLLPEFFERLAHSGLEIYQKKIGTDYPVGTRLRLHGKDGFFALGEVREYEDGTAIKPIKQFVL